MLYIITGVICYVAGALTVVFIIGRQALKEKDNFTNYFDERDIYSAKTTAKESKISSH